MHPLTGGDILRSFHTPLFTNSGQLLERVRPVVLFPDSCTAPNTGNTDRQSYVVNIYDCMPLNHRNPNMSCRPFKAVITKTAFNNELPHVATIDTSDGRPEVRLTCNRLCKSFHQAKQITAATKEKTILKLLTTNTGVIAAQ